MMTYRLALLLIGITLIVVSAFVSVPRVDLWRLGWGFVLAGAVLIGTR